VDDAKKEFPIPKDCYDNAFSETEARLHFGGLAAQWFKKWFGDVQSH